LARIALRVRQPQAGVKLRKPSKDRPAPIPLHFLPTKQEPQNSGGNVTTFKAYVFLSLFALVALGAAQAQSDDNALAQGNRFFALGQYEMALTQYRIAAAAPNEQQPVAHFNIGVCQHRLGRLPEAVRAYREAVRLTNGQYAKAAYALGLVLLDLDNVREAKQAFAQAVEVSNGRDAEALFQLALLLARAGETEAATKRLQQAIQHAGKRFPGGHNNCNYSRV
jgi:tetratricopeptide (TPR) repeat protein